MPRFSETEKERIKARLLTQAHKLFSEEGLAKTSIDKIVEASGIGKGTFYKFYDSKEGLYFELLLKEEFIMDEFIEELFQSDWPAQEKLKRFLQFSIQNFEKSLFLRGMYERNEYFLLYKKIPEEQLAQYKDKNINKLSQVIEKLKDEGAIQQHSTDVAIGLIRSLFLISVNKKIIGDTYEEVIQNLTQFVTLGLTLGEGSY